MRDNDTILLENLYSGLYLFESVEDQQRQAENLLVSSKVGREVWKRKNQPENLEAIQKARQEIKPIYQRLLKIIEPYQQDQFGKNMAHLPELTKFYLQKPDLDLIEKEYKTYMSIGSIKNKNLIKKELDFIKWAEAIHSADALERLKKEDEVKKEPEENTGVDTKSDDNTVYEDENVIVYLANDVTDPKKSVLNCKKYGKGSSLCISVSNARTYYHQYRWEDKLTTYFVWLKKDNRYMLVDAKEDGKFSYNNIKDNTDRNATPQEIIKKYPVLSKPFAQNVFKSIPIEGAEKEFYEKYYEATSIFDMETLEDKINYASFNEISDSDWDDLIGNIGKWMSPSENEIKLILQTYIESAEEDIPEVALQRFPTLGKRYWAKKRNEIDREFDEWNDEEDELEFTPHELKLFLSDKELIAKGIDKVSELKVDHAAFERQYNLLKEKTKNGVCNQEVTFTHKYFPLDLSFLKVAKRDLYFSHLISPVDLRNLREARNLQGGKVPSVDLRSLKKAKDIIFSYVEGSVDLGNLKTCTNLTMIRADEINLDSLEYANVIYIQDVKNVNLPKLKGILGKTDYNTGRISLDLQYAEYVNIPNIEEIEEMSAVNAKAINLNKLRIARDLDLNSRYLKKIDLSNAEWIGSLEAIYFDGVLELPRLKNCNTFKLANAKAVNIPVLENCSGLIFNKAENFFAPKLETAYELYAPNAKTVELPNLLKVGKTLDFSSSTSVKLKKLRELGSEVTFEDSGRGLFKVGNLDELDLRNLKKSYVVLEPSYLKTLNVSGLVKYDGLYGLLADKGYGAENLWKLSLKKLYIGSEMDRYMRGDPRWSGTPLKKLIPNTKIIVSESEEEINESFPSFKKFIINSHAR